MKSNSRLFGEDVEVPEFDELILIRRIELLKDNLAELLEVHYMERDTKRVREICKAIHWHQQINRVSDD